MKNEIFQALLKNATLEEDLGTVSLTSKHENYEIDAYMLPGENVVRTENYGYVENGKWTQLEPETEEVTEIKAKLLQYEAQLLRQSNDTISSETLKEWFLEDKFEDHRLATKYAS